VLPKASILYRAVRRRDARYDGRFFTAVVTTGIYCRPICPARTPLQKNVRFYETASQAEAAGFRACRRCRPETAPGSPPWIGPAAVVGRALRQLGPSLLGGGADDFASRFGLGERQLRRLFKRSVKATPAQVARARRLQIARRLVEKSEQPLSEVATSSGFGSVRQFNDAYRRAFLLPPSEARRLARTSKENP
jgi:AraC family transcriptional regulator of adaptative response / DNA-3-methyladenine glycosylase II